MHDGPIYTILDTQSLRDEEGFPAVKQFNPFEGVERYSLKYKKLKRTLPNLRTRSYGKSSSSFNLGYIAVADLRTTVKELFPSELWSTLDPDLAAKDRKNPNPSKPFKPQVRLAPFLDSGDRGENPLKRKTIADEDEQDEEEDIQPRGRRKKNPTDDDDNPIYDQDNPDEEAEDQVDRDSEFEESDDNEGDDYNAEQYFDAGDDDEGDYDGGGGGEDDGGYY